MTSRFRTFLVFSLAVGWQDVPFRHVFAAKDDPTGIPGIEFLGLGYDIVKGNPRGTSTSELDPGYRQRALELTNDGATTLDGLYALPNQVESIAAASCKFDSKSVELSDEESYTKELSKEATQEVGISVSGSYGPVEASGSIAYSKSEKFQEFKSTTVKTQTTVFEAKAICTEFDLRLVSNVDPTFKASFKQALDALPKEFDECNAANRNQFYKFIDTYGTHVVTEVVLGAKYILSTEMRASDVMELQKQSIDVASSLSIEIAASIKEAKDPSPKKLASRGDDANTYKVIFENFPGGNVNTPTPAPTPTPPSTPEPAGDGGGLGGGSISFNYGQTSSSSTAEETTKQIAQKSARVTEITIGGRPPEEQNWYVSGKRRTSIFA